ncbi:MAG: NTP/NDP exchange transporter [Alphaproteobacteria bacterium]|nr:NTP/NDP exchange transporter [Alphaproteobacteria bacterium]
MADGKNEPKEFTGWRSIFWPIYSYELKKFLPMALMMMGILFNYSVMRGTKDSLVVTNMGAETIPTLKLWFVLPAAVLFMIAYSKLSNIFSKNTVFYIVTSFFLGYFALFALILYPFHDFLTPDWTSTMTSDFAKSLVTPVQGWVFSSFYVMAELWGSAMISLMFWRFANDVTSLKQSKRFYAMFGFIANGALIVSGEVLKTVKDVSLVSGITVAVCLIIIGLYYWLNEYVLTDPRFFNPDEIKKPKKKVKLSLGESMNYILHSKYLGYIVLLVVCYGISINLVEVMWKDQVRLLCPTKEEFSGFMGGLQIWTGGATIFFMLVGANILRRCSWFTAAMITPLMVFVTGLIFFACIIFKEALSPVVGACCSLSILEVIAYMGLAQNVLAKGVKYSLFDSTKEMSYIPLDDELKSKGKAAVDVIGGRAGKSGGAAINFVLLNLIFIGSKLAELAPVIAGIFVVILLLWFYAVRGLNVEFLKLTTTKDSQQ